MPESSAATTGVGRHLEVETKLDAEPGFRIPDLTADPGLLSAGVTAAGPPEVVELDAVYYDTGQLDLLSARLTLRRRTGGGDAGWHLKLPAGAGARTEVRLPLRPAPDDDVPGELAALVTGAARGRPLVPVARIRTRRTVMRLHDAAGTALVEVADDTVTATRLPAGGRLRWRELEVEQLAGADERAAEALRAAVDALVAAGARAAESASKVGRLLQATTGPAAVDESAGAVLMAFLVRQRDLLIATDIRLREAEPDAEAPHDARAAARRIRSVLRVYRPLLLPGTVRPLPSQLRQLGGSISRARDLDVLRARLAALSYDGSGRVPIDGRLAVWRTEALRQVRAELASQRYLSLLRGLDRLVADPPLTAAAGEPATELQPVLLTPAWLRLRADAEAALADRADADRMHRVRKDAKTVRYAAEAASAAETASTGEAAGAAGGNGSLAAFASRLEQVQDILGAHQDSVTAASLIARLAAEPDLTPAERDLLEEWARCEAASRGRTLAEFAELWPELPVLPAARC